MAVDHVKPNLTLSVYNLILRDENQFGAYTNYAMESPITPGGDSIQLDSFNHIDSDFDDTLAVPESLSVIDKNKTADNLDGNVPPKTHIAFMTVHDPAIKFKSPHRKVFIPGVEIKVKFIENERSVTQHLINPNLYTIQLQHGDFTWTIKKRYKHILHLHQQMSLYRATLNIPFPSKTHKYRRASLKNAIESEETAERNALDAVPKASAQRRKLRKRKGALPRFPRKPEVMVPYDGIQLRMKQLEDYLYNLLNITIYRNHKETMTFLEVSQLSFVLDLGVKGKEGLITKRNGSTRPGQAGCTCCGLFHFGVCVRCNYFCTGLVCSKWQERWLFVKDTFFGYIRPRDGAVKAVMLFDQGFEVSSGLYSTGLSNGLQILNNSRQMVIKCWTKRKSKEWMSYLKEIASTTARDFTFPNIHHSFAPPRPATNAAMLVDGSAYLSAVADALEMAKEEIFIADWWLSPEIYLKRPAQDDDYWRLDCILKRKACQGVKIFVLLYKEVEMALGINSFYSKSRLAGDNIKVLRHPDHARAGVLLWAHHEKLVCIDQTVAFVGGIDLCYGRWDDHCHRLIDLGGMTNTLPTNTKKKTSSNPAGGTYSPMANVSLDDNGEPVVRDPHDTTKENGTDNQVSLDTTKDKNLPVLEPGDHLLIAPHKTPDKTPANDLSQFETPDIQKRNVLNKITGRGKEIISILYPNFEQENSTEEMEKLKALKYAAANDELLMKEKEIEEDKNESKSDFYKVPLSDIRGGKMITESGARDVMCTLHPNQKLWLGKDYCNFIVKDFTNLESPFDDLIDRTQTPRMPWHDIGGVIFGAAAKDVARHFIQRWNAVKLEKARHNTQYPNLLPKSYTDINSLKDVQTFLKLDLQPATCQIVRSVSSWSCGFLDPDTLEQSIHEAYVDTITKAQHYLYIENQFFITLSRTNPHVRNQIGEALFNRIVRAYKADSPFRVFVVMPLLPAFEGELGTPSATSLHAITHWNYQSICRSKESILSRLYEAGIEDPSKYITFHGLRTHARLEGEPVTELIYVHSKLLLADDRTLICGSANINDRSMIGMRDSEVAMVIQDEVFEEGTLNRQPFPSGMVVGRLRRRLFQEHLGFLDMFRADGGATFNDICCDAFYRDVWQKISKENTAIYEEVFHCMPSDEIQTFAQLKKYQEEHEHSLWHTDPALANAKINRIKGNVVDLPLNFLANEVLTPSTTTIEGIMPTSLWT